MAEKQCYSSDELKAYALGRLDDPDSEYVAAHVADCLTCEETLAGFDDTADSLVDHYRRAARTESLTQSSDQLQKALDRIAEPSVSPSRVDDTVVQDVVRDYELLEKLGSGGMGTVYRAVHSRLQRVVALKILPSRRLRNRAAVERFEREMQAIGRLDHPTIVRATDAGEYDGTHFLAMDYVDGVDLSRVVRLNGPLRTADACEIIRQAAHGLQYAHEQGLIHRDVKPSNMMLECRRAGHDSTGAAQQANVKLLDLGLALFGSASESVDELTTVGQLMGTLDYMAPEQADNSHEVSAKADVYSLGATLFKLLSGTAPYETHETRTILQKMKALATVDAPSVRERCPDLDESLAQVVDRMLVRDQSERISSAAEVAAALEPFCEGHDLQALAASVEQKRSESARAAALLVTPGDEERHSPSMLHNGAASASEKSEATAAAAAQYNDQPPRRRKFMAGLAAFGLPLSVLFGVVIWLQTNTGTLKIVCSDDNVPVTIRRGNSVVEHLTLEAGEKKVTLRSGDYEIVLPSLLEDRLRIQGNEFQMTRNGEKIVTISRVPSAPRRGTSSTSDKPAADWSPEGVIPIPEIVESGDSTPPPNNTSNNPSPTFESKTFQEWRVHAKTERSPVELERAIAAFTALGAGGRDFDAAIEIMGITRRYTCDLSRQTPEARLLCSAIRSLRKLDPKAVVTSAWRELNGELSGNHELIAGWLFSDSRTPLFSRGGGDSTDWDLGSPEPLRSHLFHDDYFRRWLIEARPKIWQAAAAIPDQYGNPTGGGRGPTFAIEFLIRNWESERPIADALKCLEEIVEDTEDPRIVGLAAMVLAKYRPDEKLVEPLLKSLRGSLNPNFAIPGIKPKTLPTYQILPALKGLSYLGHRGRGAVPALLELASDAAHESRLHSGQPLGIRLSENQEVQIRLVIPAVLIADVIGKIGKHSKEARPFLHRVFKSVCRHVPVDDDDGDYEIAAGWEVSLCEAMAPAHYSNLSDPAWGPAELVQVNDAVIGFNAVAFAWQNVTGSPPRFSRNWLSNFHSQNGESDARWHPRLVGFRGTSVEKLKDPTSFESETMEELGDRFQLFRELPEQFEDARLELAKFIVRDDSYSDQHLALMRDVLEFCRESEIDSVLAESFQNASPEQKARILANVLAPTCPVIHLHKQFGGLGVAVRESATHLTEICLAVTEHPQLQRQLANLAKDLKRLPPPLQAAMIDYVEGALIDSLKVQQSADGSEPNMESENAIAGLRKLADSLVDLLRSEDPQLRLRAALALSYDPDSDEGTLALVRSILLETITAGGSNSDWINAAVALPRVYKEIPAETMSSLVQLCIDDTQDAEHRFNVLVSDEHYTAMQELNLSRRSLLLYVIGMRPMANQDDRNAAAVKLFRGLQLVLLHESKGQKGRTQLRQFFQAVRLCRVGPVVHLDKSQNAIDTATTRAAFESAMTSLLGTNWFNAVNELAFGNLNETKESPSEN